MAEAKKNKNKKNKKIPLVVLIIVCLVIVFATGLIWLYYQSQRPNYRDLEKAYNQLQIPSDWKQVSEYKVTGYEGMFCFTAGIDEACPKLDKTYSLNSDNNPEEIAKKLTDSSKSDVVSNSCSNENITCQIEFRYNRTKLIVYIESSGEFPKTVKITSSIKNE